MLSIITPVYNGEKFISIYSNAIKSQKLGKDQYEIILVDNGSTDASYSILIEQFGECKHVTIVQFTKKQSSYAARNYGVELSRGNILVFTDIDCVPSNDWLTMAYTLSLHKGQNVILSGRIVQSIKNNENVFELYDSIYFLNQEKKSVNNEGVTANLIVPRGVFIDVEGFKEFTSGADSLFCNHAVEKGYDLVYSPELIVGHPCRSSYCEIKDKSNRIAFGIAETIIETKGNTTYSFFYNLIGSVLNLHQIKTIFTYIKKNGFLKILTIQFIFTSIYFGMYTRLNISKNIFIFWVKKSINF